jgi:organic radical activating enzyme
MYRLLYNTLRASRLANFLLHSIVEGKTLNRLPVYRFFYRKLIRRRAVRWMMHPPFLVITVTDRCNADCVMCPPAVHSGTTVINASLYTTLIGQAVQCGIKKLILTGGEPLTDPGIFDKIGFAKTAGFRHVHMFTNGQLLTRDRAVRLMEAGLDSLTLSIDSAVQEEYERIRRGLSFTTVMDHIRSFKQWRKEAGHTNPLFRLNRVNLPENRNSASRFITEFDRYADIVELIDAHNFAEHAYDDTLAGSLYKQDVRYPCNLLFQQIVVSPQGFFRKCSIDYSDHAVIASAVTCTVEQALVSRLAAIKRCMIAYDFSEPGCSECGHKQSWWIDWEM